jgi:hypothetical protein
VTFVPHLHRAWRFAALFVAASLAVTACGGGGEDDERTRNVGSDTTATAQAPRSYKWSQTTFTENFGDVPGANSSHKANVQATTASWGVRRGELTLPPVSACISCADIGTSPAKDVGGSFPEDARRMYSVSSYRDVAVGDINRDGISDILTLRADGEVNATVSNGDGTIPVYVANLSFLVKTASSASLIELVDVTRNGEVDLLVLGSSGLYVLADVPDWFNTPNVNSQQAVKASLGLYVDPRTVTGMQAANLMGRGPVDLVFTTKGYVSVLQLQPRSEGIAFAPILGRSEITAVENPVVQVRDIDGDSLDDLVVLSQTNGQVRFATRATPGSVAEWKVVTAVATTGPAVDATVGFIDDNDDIDVVVSSVGDSVVVTLNALQPTKSTTSFAWPSGKVQLADLTNDGLDDLVHTNRATSEVTISRNVGGAKALEEWRDVVFGSVKVAASAMFVRDLNGDNRPDILETGDSHVRVAYAAATQLPLSWPTTKTLRRANALATTVASAVADFNNDGLLDVVSATSSSIGAWIVTPGVKGKRVALEGQTNFPVDLQDGARPRSITTGDFNKDGLIDLVIGTDRQDLYYVNTTAKSPGWFVRSAVLPSRPGVTSEVIAGDIDADGNIDVVRLGSYGAQVVFNAGPSSPFAKPFVKVLTSGARAFGAVGQVIASSRALEVVTSNKGQGEVWSVGKDSKSVSPLTFGKPSAGRMEEARVFVGEMYDGQSGAAEVVLVRPDDVSVLAVSGSSLAEIGGTKIDVDPFNTMHATDMNTDGTMDLVWVAPKASGVHELITAIGQRSSPTRQTRSFRLVSQKVIDGRLTGQPWVIQSLDITNDGVQDLFIGGQTGDIALVSAPTARATGKPLAVRANIATSTNVSTSADPIRTVSLQTRIFSEVTGRGAPLGPLFEVSNDAKQWYPISDGETVEFASNGSQLFWRVALPSFWSRKAKPLVVSQVILTARRWVRPTAPREVRVIPGDRYVDVSWTPPDPATSGEPAFYGASAKWGSQTASCLVKAPQKTCRISGLSNLEEVEVTTTAANAAGDASAPTGAVTVGGVPRRLNAPTLVAANKKITVSWLANVNSATDLPIDNYVVSVDGSSVSCETETTSCDLIGLTSSAAIRARVVAYNSSGAGEPSAWSAYVAPLSKPGMVRDLVLTPSPAFLTATWKAPTEMGGGDLTYTVVLNGKTDTTCVVDLVVERTPCVVSETGANLRGFAKNADNEVSVVATNGVFTSDKVTLSQRYGVGPPVPVVSAEAGDREVAVSWTEPSGSDPSTYYRVGRNVLASNNNWNVCEGLTGGTRECTASGLKNGEPQRFVVWLYNAFGFSFRDTWVTPVGVPTEPLRPTVAVGEKSMTVTWSASATDNGAAIERYEVVLDGQGQSCTVKPDKPLTCTFSDLEPGVQYGVSLVAVNTVGKSASAAVVATPLGKATAVQNLVATSKDKSLALEWEAPSDTGGSDVAGYSVTLDGVAVAECRGPATSCTISGLRNGTTYEVSVTAITEAGIIGEPAGTKATPMGRPGAPKVEWDFAPRGFFVRISPPDSNGGGAIVGHQCTVRSASGAELISQECFDNSLVGPLPLGEVVTLEIRARNVAGAGEAWSSSMPRVRTVPGAPQFDGTFGGVGMVGVGFREPVDNGGGAIKSYVLSATPLSGGKAIKTEISHPANQVTIDIAVPGRYEFRLSAVGEAGEGDGAYVWEDDVYVMPSAPRNVVAKNAKGSIDVTWDKPATDGGRGITGYVVSYFDTETGEVGDEFIDAPATKATLSNVRLGVGYEVSVSAVDPWVTGESAVFSSIVIPARPAGPVEITRLDTGDGWARVTWNPPAIDGGSPLTGFVAKVMPSGGTCEIVANSCSFTGLDRSTSHYVEIVAVNGAGEGEPAMSRNFIAALAAPPDLPKALADLMVGSVTESGDQILRVVVDNPKEAPLPRSSAELSVPATRVAKAMRPGQRLSAVSLARLMGIKVPKGSTISLSVTSSAAPVCTVTSRRVTAVKVGDCSVTFTTKPKKGKSTTKTVRVPIVS